MPPPSYLGLAAVAFAAPGRRTYAQLMYARLVCNGVEEVCRPSEGTAHSTALTGSPPLLSQALGSPALLVQRDSCWWCEKGG